MTHAEYGRSSHRHSVDVVVRQLDSDAVLVEAVGEIDLRTDDEVRTALFDVLASPSPGVLIADLSEVWFFDSCGVATVVDAHQRAQTVGTDLRVVSNQRAVRMPLAITSVDRFLNLYDDLESARHRPDPTQPTSP